MSYYLINEDKLVKTGFKLCEQTGYKAMAVVGHPGVYSCFGCMSYENYYLRY